MAFIIVRPPVARRARSEGLVRKVGLVSVVVLLRIQPPPASIAVILIPARQERPCDGRPGNARVGPISALFKTILLGFVSGGPQFWGRSSARGSGEC